MRVLWVANGINIVLDPCLINGWGPFPRLNVMGAAVATTTGRGMGVRVAALALWSAATAASGSTRHQIPHPAGRDVAAAASIVHRHAAVRDCHRQLDGSGAALRAVRQRAGGRIYGRDQDLHVRDSAVLGTVELGRNTGRSEPRREEAGAGRGCGLSDRPVRHELHGRGRSGFPCLSRAQLAAFFTPDPAVQDVAADCLRFISVGNICYAWGMVLVQAFNGAGDTRTPSLINFFCYWCFQIPLAWMLAVTLRLGPRGVFAAIPAAETAMTLSSLVLFRRGAWKRKLI